MINAIPLLGMSAALAVVDASSALPFDGYERIGITGVLIVAVVALWKDSRTQQAKFEGALEKMTATLTQVHDVMSKCAGPGDSTTRTTSTEIVTHPN